MTFRREAAARYARSLVSPPYMQSTGLALSRLLRRPRVRRTPRASLGLTGPEDRSPNRRCRSAHSVRAWRGALRAHRALTTAFGAVTLVKGKVVTGSHRGGALNRSGRSVKLGMILDCVRYLGMRTTEVHATTNPRSGEGGRRFPCRRCFHTE